MSKIKRSVIVPTFFILAIFALTTLFSALLSPFGQNIAYSTPFSFEDSSSPLGQQPDQTVGGGGAGNATANSVSIVPGGSELTSGAFSPNPIQVSVGDTVTWRNDDSQPHTVTSGSDEQPDGKFDSSPNFNPLLNAGQTFEHTFTEAGEYPYYCALHPNQVGTVIVTTTTGTAPTGGSGQTAGEAQLIEGNRTQSIMLEYGNPTMGLSMSYPENWDVDNHAFDRERAVSFYLYQGPNDVYGETVYVQVNASGEASYFQSPDMSLDEIAQQLVAFLQSGYNDFQHISTDAGQVAGVPASAIHYTYSDPALGQTEAMEVIVKVGDRLYDFLYTAKPDQFNTELPTFREMVDSVQIALSAS